MKAIGAMMKMRRLSSLVVLACAGALAQPVHAQTVAPPSPAPAAPSPAPQTRGNVQTGGLPPPPRIPVLPRVPNVAPGYAAPNIATPPGTLVGVTQQPFVGLTLGNAVGMALSRNSSLAIAQSNRRIAQYQISAARGAFDVRLNIEPSYTYSKSAPQNAFFAGPNFGPIVQTTAALNGNVQGITPGGQQYQVQIGGQRIANNSTINSFDPYYPTLFSASFTQPLTRNRGINDATRALQLAQIGSETTDAQTLTTVSSTIAQVENAYWGLVSAWRDVAVQEEALRSAEVQAASNRRLARAGANAPIEIVQSNTQVNVFTDNVFAALQNVASLQNELKSLVVSDPSDPIWAANLVPTTPVLQLPPEPSLAELVTGALRDRPEMAQVRELRQQADVNVAYAANQLKPQLNLQLGYTSNGFAGEPVNPALSPFAQSSAQQVIAIDQLIAAVNKTLPPNQQIPPLVQSTTPVPPYLVGGLDRSIRNLLENQFPTYTVGVQYAVPLGNRTARAQYGIAQEQLRQAQLQEAATISRIAVEARNALQAYRTAEYRLIAARAARQASQQVLASEQRRFRNGVSTTFLVLQRQIEVADNRERELAAQTALNDAVVELERVSGAILRDNNVTITTIGQGVTTP